MFLLMYSSCIGYFFLHIHKKLILYYVGTVLFTVEINYNFGISFHPEHNKQHNIAYYCSE
jgi:hypothetical protein